MAVEANGNNETQHTDGKESAMNQASEHDKKASKDREDHHDDANPMPDTHHVNPDADDDSSDDKKPENDR